jgi:Rrf2 family protein
VLRLSRRSEYGVIAVTDLALHPAEAVSVREIAERYHIPKRILAEVMKDLVHSGLVRSTRGASGGYRLAVDPAKTSIGKVLGALEGPFEMVPCTSETETQGSEICELLASCPIRGTVHRIYDRIHGFLEGVTLEEIAHAPAFTSLAVSPTATPSPLRSAPPSPLRSPPPVKPC